MIPFFFHFLFSFSLFEPGHVPAFSLGLGNWPNRLLTYPVMLLRLADFLPTDLEGICVFHGLHKDECVVSQ
jgi:hypothetical protein